MHKTMSAIATTKNKRLTKTKDFCETVSLRKLSTVIYVKGTYCCVVKCNPNTTHNMSEKD